MSYIHVLWEAEKSISTIVGQIHSLLTWYLYSFEHVQWATDYWFFSIIIHVFKNTTINDGGRLWWGEVVVG